MSAYTTVAAVAAWSVAPGALRPSFMDITPSTKRTDPPGPDPVG